MSLWRQSFGGAAKGPGGLCEGMAKCHTKTPSPVAAAVFWRYAPLVSIECFHRSLTPEVSDEEAVLRHTVRRYLGSRHAAQNVFDGTWKIDFSKTAFPSKPDEYLQQNGVYTCKTCNETKLPVKADGTDQPLTNSPYADTLAIKVVNDHQLHIMSKKAGKVVGESTLTVSPDGKTLTED
jgi:hypothetical protein